MDLNESVMIALPENGKIIWYPGVLVGRTLERYPRYDVRLANGKIIANVSADQLRPADRVQLADCG